MNSGKFNGRGRHRGEGRIKPEAGGENELIRSERGGEALPSKKGS